MRLDGHLDQFRRVGAVRHIRFPAIGADALVCRGGDTLVVWRLDRLGRSLKDLIAHAESLCTQGVGLRSLKEAIDTDSSTGQLVFHIFARWRSSSGR